VGDNNEAARIAADERRQREARHNSDKIAAAAGTKEEDTKAP
jgi:hypothetical protein